MRRIADADQLEAVQIDNAVIHHLYAAFLYHFNDAAAAGIYLMISADEKGAYCPNLGGYRRFPAGSNPGDRPQPERIPGFSRVWVLRPWLSAESDHRANIMRTGHPGPLVSSHRGVSDGSVYFLGWTIGVTDKVIIV